MIAHTLGTIDIQHWLSGPCVHMVERRRKITKQNSSQREQEEEGKIELDVMIRCFSWCHGPIVLTF
jgi:hypothetical protein